MLIGFYSSVIHLIFVHLYEENTLIYLSSAAQN